MTRTQGASATRAAERVARGGRGLCRGGGGGGGGGGGSSSRGRVAAAGIVAEGGSGAIAGGSRAVAGRAFAGAWLARLPEPSPGSREAWDLGHTLTFPACNPVKRIDDVLVRANTGGGGGGGGGGPPAPRWAVEVTSVEVVGQAPSAATAAYIAREGLGMFDDDDSPLWATRAAARRPRETRAGPARGCASDKSDGAGSLAPTRDENAGGASATRAAERRRERPRGAHARRERGQRGVPLGVLRV